MYARELVAPSLHHCWPYGISFGSWVGITLTWFIIHMHISKEARWQAQANILFTNQIGLICIVDCCQVKATWVHSKSFIHSTHVKENHDSNSKSCCCQYICQNSFQVQWTRTYVCPSATLIFHKECPSRPRSCNNVEFPLEAHRRRTWAPLDA